MFEVSGKGGGGGGKGGGGGGSTPTEAPNTLQSRSTARVVDLIGEGEIVGLVNGAQSIFFDDTPLQNSDGTFNFSNVTYDQRFGTPDQDPLSGFPDVETEVAVGVVVTNLTPVVRTFTDATADAIRVTLRLPNGLFQTDASGNVNDSTVQIAIDVQANGGSYVREVLDTISGKTTSPYEKAYRIELTGSAPWNIKVYRLTADDQGITVQNGVTFSSYTIIVDHHLIYPDSALLGIAVDAQAFGGSIPTRSYHIQGRIINVPSNYDPVTAVYTGLWDGSFKLVYSTNPAWCFYDMLMHERYGLGDFVTENGTKWDLYPIAQYCDGLVPDGLGGMERRYTFNGGFATADDAFRIMQAMASVFMGMCWWGSDTVAVSADMPTDPSKLVALSNVITNSMTLAGTAFNARHTAVIVSWNDPTDQYRINYEVVESDDAQLIERLGWRTTSAAAIGCTSQSEARRIGRWMLDSEKGSTQAVTYQASWDHADLIPGDVIAVSDPAFSKVRRGGRVVSVANNGGSPLLCTGITLDAPVTLAEDIVYTLYVTLPNGTLTYTEITNAPGDATEIVFATPLAVLPLPNAMWTLSGNDAAPRPFRVMGVKETAVNVFEITGIFYDATKYARVEQGYIIQPPVFVTVPTGPIIAPTDLAVAEYLYLAGGVNAKNAVTVSWQPSRDARVQLYEVHVQSAALAWQTRATSSAASADLLDFGTGTFDFRVRALDGLGRPSPWTYLTQQGIIGLNEFPEDVQDFRISILGDVATLTWDPVPNLNLSNYQIRFTPDTVSPSWQTSVTMLDNIKTTSVQVPALVGSYSIKAVTLQGQYSVNEAIVTSNVALFNQLNAVATLTEDPAFAGVYDNTLLDSDFPGVTLAYASDFFAAADFFTPADFFLREDGFEDSGYYYFANSLDLGDVYTSRITASLVAFGENFSADFFDGADFFSPADFFRIQPNDWAVSLQYRTTNSDPISSPADFSPWADFIVGDVTARAIQFRVKLTATDFGVSPVVMGLSVLVDMPDRILSDNDLTVGVIGLRVDFLPPYRGFTGVGISEQGLQTGDYPTITSKDETGFNIQFFDHTNAAVVRTFDYVAVGYGRKES